MPPPCPIFAPLPTLMPPVTEPPPPPTTTTAAPALPAVEQMAPAPAAPPQNCTKFEVPRTDGTCSPITPEILAEIEKVAKKLKVQVDQAEAHMKAVENTGEYYPARKQALVLHIEYKKAMDLLLGALGSFEEMSKMAEDEEPMPLATTGPEFVPGIQAHGVHCEEWTKFRNVSLPSHSFCAILCRHEPKCVGFAVDTGYNWCNWYDGSVPPFEGKQCSVQTATTFVKKRQAEKTKMGEASWAAIEKVRKLEEMFDVAMSFAGEGQEATNTTYLDWNGEGNPLDVNNTYFQGFTGAKGEYAVNLNDALLIRTMLRNATADAYAAMTKEMEEESALAEPGAAPAPAAPVTTPPPMLEPSPTPNLLRWKDFDNSHDTQWSEMHPDCPMGTPCFCDCRCRGPPPQNFAVPPPLPPMPCPSAPPLPGMR